MTQNIDSDIANPEINNNDGLEVIEKAMDKINKLNIEQENLENATETQDINLESSEEDEKTQASNEINNDIELDLPTEYKENEPTVPIETQKQKEKKYWKARRLQFKAQAERDQIAEELEAVRQERDEALKVGSYHYGQNAYLDLEKAKEKRRKAIEDGDSNEFDLADEALAKARNAVSDIEKWELQNNNNIQQNHTRDNTSSHKISTEQIIAQDWIASRPDINPKSKSYNHDLAEKVSSFINKLDSNIVANNNQQYYFSEEYFDQIDNQIERLQRPVSQSNTRPLSVDNVSGVKRSYQSQPGNVSSKQKILLTADEKRMASNAGLSDATWLKYKIESLAKKKKRV
jgi:hypothetical protein